MNVERKDHLIVRYRELHTGERPLKPPSLTLLQQLQSGHYPKLVRSCHTLLCWEGC